MRRRLRLLFPLSIGLGVVGLAWVAGAVYPDQTFSVYLRARDLLRAAGPTDRLPVSILSPNAAVDAAKRRTSQFVVLPASSAMGIAGSGTWEVTAADIGILEVNLPEISMLKVQRWQSSITTGIDHPERYFRQYVAIVRQRKRLILVNAFCNRDALSYWHEHLVTVFDGGSCCWRAYYDLATESFFDLTVNGVA